MRQRCGVAFLPQPWKGKSQAGKYPFQGKKFRNIGGIMSIVVGFSVNRETSMETVPTSAQKVPVERLTECIGGSSVSVARVLQVLGEQVKLMAIVGSDQNENQAASKQLGDEWGIPHNFYQLRHNLPRTVCIIEKGHSRVYPYRDPIAVACDQRQDAERSIYQVVSCMPDLQAVVATSVRPDEVPFVKAMFSGASNGALKVLNPNQYLLRKQNDWRSPELLQNVDLLVLNHHEAALALQIPDAEFRPEAIREFRSFEVQEVLVTWNSEGAYYWDGNELLHQEALALDGIVDSTGAGDAFLAGFLHLRLKGASVRRALVLATACAAAKVNHVGGYSPPMFKEIQHHLESLLVKL